jgi:rhodanese-related sulfurtransferase
MFKFLEKLFGSGNNEEIAELLEKGAVVIDVRTPFEFKRGHMPGSINIPLESIDRQFKLLKIKRSPIITCCRSGHRSGIAQSILKENGFQAFNGGSWKNVRKAAGLRAVN